MSWAIRHSNCGVQRHRVVEDTSIATRGMVYYDKGDLNKAIADYTRALEVRSQNIECLARSWSCLLRERKALDKGLADVKLAVQTDPQDAEALTIGGMIFYERDELEKAFIAFDRATQDRPQEHRGLGLPEDKPATKMAMRGKSNRGFRRCFAT